MVEDGLDVGSDTWADWVCERDFLDGHAWWDEDSVVGEP